jgi:nucleoside transporter
MQASESTNSAPPLPINTRIVLSIMMLLQFAIWGSWVIVYYPFLIDKGFTPIQATTLNANMYLGAMLSTIFAGYIADRFINSERLMAICHFAGAGLLFAMSRLTDPSQFTLLFIVTFCYSIFFNPTLAVVNSIAFRNVPDGARDFPGLRVLGTIGWICAGLCIDLIFSGKMINREGVEVLRTIGTSGPLVQASVISSVLAVFSLIALPKTPPTGQGAGALDFLRAVGMLKDFSYAVFFVITLVASIAMGMYFNSAGDFLDKQVKVPGVGSTLAIGQGVELFLLVLLPFFLKRFGLKTVMTIGLFCWAFRYLLFAHAGSNGIPFALAIIGVAVHGFCFDFFFASGFIHADQSAPKDLRASAQSLLGFLVYGLGTYLGTLFCGLLNNRFQDPETKAVNWFGFWIVPSIGLFIALAAFIALFWPKKNAVEANA